MKDKIFHISVSDLSLLITDLQDAQRHIISGEYVTAIGALAGAPERLQQVVNRLTVLRDVEENKEYADLTLGGNGENK